jgi:hypothetical protein
MRPRRTLRSTSRITMLESCASSSAFSAEKVRGL